MSSKKLFDIIPVQLAKAWQNKEDCLIEKLVFDSREVTPGALFFAIKGVQVDGHDYVEAALEKGASAVVVMEALGVEIKNQIVVEDSSYAMGLIAAAFYGEPSSKIKLVGITGTNGKTTVATLLHQLLTSIGKPCGLISTVFYDDGKIRVDATHTTPDAIRLNALLAQMVENGCEYAIMEVSSHAIHQQRIAGVSYAGAVFTNLTHEHLDYHKDFKDYLNCKKQLFDSLNKKAFAIYNNDDRNGAVMVQNCKAEKIDYSLRHMSAVKGKLMSNTIEGLQMTINGYELYARLVGSYNAYNLMAAYATASSLGFEDEEVLLGLSRLKGAEGRFELIRGEKKKIFAVIDYAHTPDALKNILETLVQLKKRNTKLICVVGCGGDRDTEKRPVMARLAAELSDQLLLTSDNPRTEDPDKILDDMEAGLDADGKENALRISERKQAIKTAVMMAQEGDIILIAGKGHEKYQDINGVKAPFDDVLEVEKLVLNNKN